MVQALERTAFELKNGGEPNEGKKRMIDEILVEKNMIAYSILQNRSV